MTFNGPFGFPKFALLEILERKVGGFLGALPLFCLVATIPLWNYP